MTEQCSRGDRSRDSGGVQDVGNIAAMRCHRYACRRFHFEYEKTTFPRMDVRRHRPAPPPPNPTCLFLALDFAPIIPLKCVIE